MKIAKKSSLFLLIGITVSIPIMTLAQNKNCPILPHRDVILSDSETPLYNLPSLNSPIVYIIKKNQAFRLLDLSGKYIDKMCWYKVEPPLFPLNNETAWAGFFIAEKPTIQPSITPTIQKNNPTPISKPTPINHPRKVEASKNYPPYLFIATSIIAIFLLFLLHEIILSLQKKSKPKLRKKSKQITASNSKNINQDNIPKLLIDNTKSNSHSLNISQQSNSSNISEQAREIELGILNYLRKNENASFIDLLSNLQCDKQPLRDRLLILQEEEFIKIINKTDENNTIYKML
jgi:hypothetical protein